jgi:hypothetical protein
MYTQETGVYVGAVDYVVCIKSNEETTMLLNPRGDVDQDLGMPFGMTVEQSNWGRFDCVS